MKYSNKKIGLESISISLIDDPICPNREEVDLSKIKELSERIDTHGQLVPIIVRKKANNRYERIAGFRRIKAHKLLGLKEIQANIYDVNDEEVCMMMFEENNKREPNGVIDILKMHIHLIEMRLRRDAHENTVKISTINFAQLLIKACRKIETAHLAAIKKEAGTYQASKARNKLDNTSIEGLEKIIEEVVESFGHYKSIASFRTQLYYLEMENEILELISRRKLSLAAGLELDKWRNKNDGLSNEEKDLLLQTSVKERYSKKQVKAFAQKMIVQAEEKLDTLNFSKKIAKTFKALNSLSFENLSSKEKMVIIKAIEKINKVTDKR